MVGAIQTGRHQRPWHEKAACYLLCLTSIVSQSFDIVDVYTGVQSSPKGLFLLSLRQWSLMKHSALLQIREHVVIIKLIA